MLCIFVHNSGIHYFVMLVVLWILIVAQLFILGVPSLIIGVGEEVIIAILILCASMMTITAHTPPPLHNAFQLN